MLIDHDKSVETPVILELNRHYTLTKEITMPYKYVLVGIYYEGTVPKMYPDCKHSEEEYCRCQQKVADAMDNALMKSHKGLTYVDTAFLKDTKEPWAYVHWSWRHYKEVFKYYLWKVFIFLYKR